MVTEMTGSVVSVVISASLLALVASHVAIACLAYLMRKDLLKTAQEQNKILADIQARLSEGVRATNRAERSRPEYKEPMRDYTESTLRVR
jgi:hypothetical protein